ncbi:hypothetical protein FRC01_001354, partial [Tulasnella sp. 417]
LQEAVSNRIELYAAGEVLLPFGVGSLEEWIQPDIDRINELSDQSVTLAQRLVNMLESKKGKLSFHVERYVEATGGPSAPPGTFPAAEPGPSTPRIAPSPSLSSTPGPSLPSVPPPSPSARAALVNSSSVKINLSSPSRAHRRSEVTRKESPAPYKVAPLPRPRAYHAPSPPPPLTLPDPSEIPPHPGPLPRGRGRPRLPSPPSQAVDTPEPEDPTFAHPKIDGSEEEEDTTLYCFCRQLSHGEFHLACVGRSEPPPNEEKWYCSDDCAEDSTSHASSPACPDPHALLTNVEEELVELAIGHHSKEPPMLDAGPSNKNPPERASTRKRRSPRRNRKKKT